VTGRAIESFSTRAGAVILIMVFVIQRHRTKDAMAVQIKLSELLAGATRTADQMLAFEVLSEAELRRLHARYLELARRGERPAVRELETSSSREAPS
jgi:low affinity Fe/Cu permease